MYNFPNLLRITHQSHAEIYMDNPALINFYLTIREVPLK